MPADLPLEIGGEEARFFEQFLHVVLAEVEVRAGVFRVVECGWGGEGDDIGQRFEFGDGDEADGLAD